MVVDDLGDRGPIDLDGAAGTNLLAVPAPIAPFPPDGRVGGHIDAVGGAVIDAEGALRIEAFVPMEGKIEAAEAGLLQQPRGGGRGGLASFFELPAGAAPGIEVVVVTAPGQSRNQAGLAGEYPAAAFGNIASEGLSIVEVDIIRVTIGKIGLGLFRHGDGAVPVAPADDGEAPLG